MKMFGLQSVGGGPMAASRFGVFRHTFLRHASAVSTAIDRNMSIEVVEPSHLVDPSESFEKQHRHYSLMAVLTIMTLFLLITVSISGLLLGFCRKRGGGRSSSYPRSEGKTDGGSQFELNDIDLDAETKMRKGDPHGVCYFHLSDDDNDDDDDDEEDYMDDGGASGDSASIGEKRSKRERRRRERKCNKLRRDRGDYYHLYNNDDEDSSSWDERGVASGSDTGSNIMPDSGSSSAKGLAPKRSTTFPQLHNVLTSCIKGHNSRDESVEYTKLLPSSSLTPSELASSDLSENNFKTKPSSSTRHDNIRNHEHSSSPTPSDAHQQRHVQASVQIRNTTGGAANSPERGNMRTNSGGTERLPGAKSIHNRHLHHKQRQARNQRQSQNHHLHQQQQRKLRPRHMQHYNSLSYHRHTKLHHAVRHTAWTAHKRIPLAAWHEGGGGLMYKSHSIHAIHCSETKEQQQSAGTPQQDSQCQVQIKVERVEYNGGDATNNCDLLHRQDV